MRNHHQLSDKRLKEFKEICDKEGIHYDTEAEYRESAQNLYNLVGVLYDMSAQQLSWKKRLESEPKGFSLAGEGRNCSLCGEIVHNTNGWYDKWGFKCLNCQDAVSKKIIPGSLCGDYDHKKYMTESTPSWKSGLRAQTIRKLIRHGKIKARQIPNGPNLILRKENPDLRNVIAQERSALGYRSSASIRGPHES